MPALFLPHFSLPPQLWLSDLRCIYPCGHPATALSLTFPVAASPGPRRRKYMLSAQHCSDRGAGTEVRAPQSSDLPCTPVLLTPHWAPAEVGSPLRVGPQTSPAQRRHQCLCQMPMLNCIPGSSSKSRLAQTPPLAPSTAVTDITNRSQHSPTLKPEGPSESPSAWW